MVSRNYLIVMIFLSSLELFKILPQVKNKNNQEEYYLTDVINILRTQKEPVYIEKTMNINEIIGINTIEQLKNANNVK